MPLHPLALHPVCNYAARTECARATCALKQAYGLSVVRNDNAARVTQTLVYKRNHRKLELSFTRGGRCASTICSSGYVCRIVACPSVAGIRLYLRQFSHRIALAPPVDADYALIPINSYYERGRERERERERRGRTYPDRCARTVACPT